MIIKSTKEGHSWAKQPVVGGALLTGRIRLRAAESAARPQPDGIAAYGAPARGGRHIPIRAAPRCSRPSRTLGWRPGASATADGTAAGHLGAGRDAGGP